MWRTPVKRLNASALLVNISHFVAVSNIKKSQGCFGKDLRQKFRRWYTAKNPWNSMDSNYSEILMTSWQTNEFIHLWCDKINFPISQPVLNKLASQYPGSGWQYLTLIKTIWLDQNSNQDPWQDWANPAYCAPRFGLTSLTVWFLIAMNFIQSNQVKIT